MPGKHYTTEEARRAWALWKRGYSPRTIAQGFKRSESGVRHLIDRLRAEKEAPPKPRYSPWKMPGILERHRELYDLGVSHSRIAKALTEKFGVRITRNASIGKTRRMKYPSRKGMVGTNGRAKKHPMPKVVKPAPKPKPDTVAPMSMQITLIELTDKTCKWPTHGSGENARFCGWRSLPGKSYCAHHHERSLERRKATPSAKKEFSQYSNWLSKRVIAAGG